MDSDSSLAVCSCGDGQVANQNVPADGACGAPRRRQLRWTSDSGYCSMQLRRWTTNGVKASAWGAVAAVQAADSKMDSDARDLTVCSCGDE
jgi:hypothetical protein